MTRLPDLAGQKHFVDDGIDFVEIENQVQLADVVEVFVEDFDEVVDRLEIHEIIVADVDADAEIESRVPPVDDLEVSKLDEVGVFGVSDRDAGVDLLDQLLLFVVVEIHVPLGQTSLSRPILDEDEADHGGGGGVGGWRFSGS